MNLINLSEKELMISHKNPVLQDEVDAKSLLLVFLGQELNDD